MLWLSIFSDFLKKRERERERDREREKERERERKKERKRKREREREKGKIECNRMRDRNMLEGVADVNSFKRSYP